MRRDRAAATDAPLVIGAIDRTHPARAFAYHAQANLAYACQRLGKGNLQFSLWRDVLPAATGKPRSLLASGKGCFGQVSLMIGQYEETETSGAHAPRCSCYAVLRRGFLVCRWVALARQGCIPSSSSQFHAH
jgi:hypothetical protein